MVRLGMCMRVCMGEQRKRRGEVGERLRGRRREVDGEARNHACFGRVYVGARSGLARCGLSISLMRTVP